MFTFARNRKEARITAEFYINAIHVMRGATALGGGQVENYVALPQREAFRIEYWSLEEAKLRRMPPEGFLARKVVRIDGPDKGVGAMLAALGAEVSTLNHDETVLAYGGVDMVVNGSDNIEVTPYAQALSSH
jgi:hypothetical protein